MAMVFKCDACGKICDRSNDLVRLKLFEIPGASEMAVSNRVEAKGLKIRETYDLCDVCTNMLAQLLHCEKVDE